MGVREWSILKVWGRSCLSRAARVALVQAGGLRECLCQRSEPTCRMLSDNLSGMAEAGRQIVGEEDGDTVLCKCVELLCESDTRKLCCGLTKVRISHRNNAYRACCVALYFNVILNSKEIWVNSCTEENDFIKWHSNHCTPQLWSCGTADLMINCKTPAQVKPPTFHPRVKPENLPDCTEAWKPLKLKSPEKSARAKPKWF